MTVNATAELNLDLDELRRAIQEEYAEVALRPEQGFHFHTGRPLARLLGYHGEWLQGIPETAIESFAGTGNPFSLGELRPGSRVNLERPLSRAVLLPFEEAAQRDNATLPDNQIAKQRTLEHCLAFGIDR